MPPNPKRPSQLTTKRRNQALYWLKEILRVVFVPLQLVMRWLQRTLVGLISSLGRSQRGDRVLAIVLLLIWIAILLGNFFFRVNQPFEGNFVVTEMSFTYAGDEKSPFLNSIGNVRSLEVRGSQPQSMILTGEFSSSDPVLNQKLSQHPKLTIELPDSASRLSFNPVNSSQTSELSILDLLINPETQINQLAYTTQPSQLSFCLQSVNTEPEACRYNESSSSNAVSTDSQSTGQLRLYLGQKPLDVSLESVNIPELDISPDSGEISLRFAPRVRELVLVLLSPGKLFIELPKHKQEAKAWLWKNIEVQNVHFSKQERTAKNKVIVNISTILEGKVRLRSQSLELQPDQFFIILPEKPWFPFGKKPGIKRLRYIQINDQSPQGLRTSFFGIGAGVAAGLYPEFPVQKIEPSLLSQYLSQEAINAILGFITAFTAILLPRLFPEPSKETDSSKNSD